LNQFILKSDPISLVHFVTYRCNARCRHCFIDFDDPALPRNELSVKEINELTRHLGSCLLNVNLTGGEPFLRDDLFEIALAYFKNASIESVVVPTNGMYPKAVKTFLDKFIASGITGKVIISVSIDNFAKEHDLNRGVEGLYQNAIATYQLVDSYRDYGIVANVGITITDTNYKSAVHLYDHLRHTGISSVTVCLMREEGRIIKIDREVKKEMLKTYKELTELIFKDQINNDAVGWGNNLSGILINAKNQIISKIVAETYLTGKFISYCSAGSLFGVIYPDGDVWPCEILDYKLGNLRDYGMDFLRLWNGKRAGDCRRFIKETRCGCTYECAWTINIISSFKFIPRLLDNAWKIKRKDGRE